MKLTKDQIQKAMLVGIFAAAGLYYYTTVLIGPLSTKATKAKAVCADLQKKLDAAQSKIKKVASLEASDPNAAAAREIYAAMDAGLPSSDPIAWFPTRLTELFRKTGIPKQNYRPNTESAPATTTGTAAATEVKFPGYKLSNWLIELPDADFATLGKSLATLENQEGLIQITGLAISATLKEPEKHNAQLKVSTLVKSQP